MNDTKIVDVTSDVKWVGVLDPNIVNFDIVMETKYGTTYNSYFINADKKALIETVKETFSEVFFKKLEKLTNLEDLEYIILNHTEPDHSGALRELLKECPNATVVGSGNAIRYLDDITGLEFNSMKVKDGDKIDLGNKTLGFISAPNLHWPDTLFTYLEEDTILFTCDAFGAHFCHEDMFDDLVGDYYDSFKYYFDVILKPYSKFMLKAIDKIEDLNIKLVCPGHGPILRTTWREKVIESRRLSEEYLQTIESDENIVLVAYISAYGYTKEMANAIADGLKQTGNIIVDLTDIEQISLGDLESKIVRCKGILIGSPTINQNTLLPVYKLFSLINPIRDKGKLAGSFGSYGWSGEAVQLIDSQLRNLKLDVFREGLSEKFYPFNEKENRFVDFGKKFGQKLLETE
ncbi:FprA family A-type flavoprotein [Bacteroidota bacterium]